MPPTVLVAVAATFVGGGLSGCTTTTAVAFTDDLFEPYEIVTGSARRQTVLPAHLLGGALAELAVVSIDENDDRRVRIYAYAFVPAPPRGQETDFVMRLADDFGDGSWVPMIDVALRPGVRFVDVASIGGRDRLITYEPGRLSWLDPETATEHALASLDFDYRGSTEDGIPHVDITRDLNHDGRDDLVVPDVDGFWISTQASDGSFADFVKLGPPEPFLDEIALDDRRRYRETGMTALTVPWYLSRVHEMDYDHDGRSDLVFWNRDHFDVHLQDPHGRFDPEAGTFTVEVPFDSDGIYSLAFGFGDASTFSLISGFRENTRQKVLHSFRDLNGDGVVDLVTQAVEGRSLVKQRSRFEVHFGTPTPDGTVFARDAGRGIRPRGNAGGLQPWGYASQSLQDFDGDGQVDIMFRDVDMGVGKIIQAMVGHAISLDLEFFGMEDGVYPGEPTTTRSVTPVVASDGREGVFFPAVLMGDVNGDGRSDLVVGKSRGELNVFVGVPGPDLLARQPERIAVALPDDDRNTRLVDLNGDGRQDVLVHHASATEPHRVTMLIAR